jgi:uncharacterized delta-60 repeat protein
MNAKHDQPTAEEIWIEPLEGRELFSGTAMLALRSGSRVQLAAVVGRSVVITRLNRDGTLDDRFGTGGVLISAFPGTPSSVVQSHGRFIVAGSTDTGDFVVARYNSRGALDRKFGRGGADGDGVVITDFGGDDHAQALAIRGTDGRIAVGGFTSAAVNGADFAVALYKSNGKLDSSFGGDGTVTNPFGGLDKARSVAFGKHGVVVAAGSTGPAGAATDFAVARYDCHGLLDPTFSGDGTVTADLGGYDVANQVLIQRDGKIILAGLGAATASDGTGGTFGVVRFNANGSPDDAGVLDSTSHDQFGTAAKMLTPIGSAGAASEATAGVLQRDGSLLIAGLTAAGGVGSASDVAIVRYTQAGALDPTFATSGTAIIDFAGGNDTATDIVATKHSFFVAATSVAVPTVTASLVIAAYKEQGLLIPDFALGGSEGNGAVVIALPAGI